MDKGLEISLNLAGSQSALANIVGLTPQAVQKWVSSGSFPRTEWTGETSYTSLIEKKFNGKVTKEQLLSRASLKVKKSISVVR